MNFKIKRCFFFLFFLTVNFSIKVNFDIDESGYRLTIIDGNKICVASKKNDQPIKFEAYKSSFLGMKKKLDFSSVLKMTMNAVALISHVPTITNIINSIKIT